MTYRDGPPRLLARQRIRVQTHSIREFWFEPECREIGNLAAGAGGHVEHIRGQNDDISRHSGQISFGTGLFFHWASLQNPCDDWHHGGFRA